MTTEARGVLVLRVIAIAIAVLGVVDPVITMSGRTNAVVAVVSEARGGSTDPVAGLADRVSAALAPMFTVVRGPFANADAVVVVGRDLPSSVTGPAPAFVVTPDESMPRVDIEAIEAPSRAPIDGRVTITAHLHGVGVEGRADRVTLRSGGVAVDRVTHAWSQPDEHAGITLRFLPSAVGMVPLTVSVESSDESQVARADLAIAIESRRWQVLTYDARPSWASTFVRRAIEDDRRFTVVTRTVTSRGLSIETGQSVPGLGDASKLDTFDAILVGAPDALSARDVDTLESFARERGGTVVLILDRAEPGAAARLLGVDRFTTRQGAASVPITAANGADGQPGGAGEAGVWLASELALPESLPAGSDVLASAMVGSTTRSIVWQSPRGAGRIVATGALDGWRYRADPHSAFAAFWQATMSAAAAGAAPAVDVRASESIVGPGDAIDVEVTRRGISGRESIAPAAPGSLGPPGSLRAWIERGDGTRVDSVRLWPDAMLGRYQARVRMPETTGTFRIVASDAFSTGAGASAMTSVPSSLRGEASVLVASAISRATPDRMALAAAWAHARGGSRVPAARIGELPRSVLAALHQQAQPDRAHPMRSAWWILPFAMALGVEWWSRRRRGLA